MSLYKGSLLFISALCFIIQQEFNHKVNQPYMDEFFHVNQGKDYCYGNFDKWDNKITTFPGLYYFTVMVVKAISSVIGSPQSSDSFCNLSTFRLINSMIFSFCLLWILSQSSSRLVYLVFLLPTHFFFLFLYYTDQGSLFFVLLTMFFIRKMNIINSQEEDSNNHKMSKANHFVYHVLGSLSALMAVLFRQTNIIWVFYLIGIQLVDDYERFAKAKKTESEMSEINFIRFLLANIMQIIQSIYLYLFGIVAFVIFIYLNGGILLGDKENHQMQLHFAQVAYFSLFTSVFSGSFISFIFNQSFFKMNWILLIVLSIAMFVSIWKYTITHPFLLADNRHFSFYIWSRVIRPGGNEDSIRRYLLVPFYAAGSYVNIHQYAPLLSVPMQRIRLEIFMIALFLSIVPLPLFELRYFTVAFTFFVIDSKQRFPDGSITLTLILEIVINAFVIILFIYFPFPRLEASGDYTLGRFMW